MNRNWEKREKETERERKRDGHRQVALVSSSSGIRGDGGKSSQTELRREGLRFTEVGFGFVYGSYLDGQGASDVILLVRPILQRYDLPLARVSEQLVHSYDSQAQKSLRLVHAVVNFQQHFRGVAIHVATVRWRKVRELL